MARLGSSDGVHGETASLGGDAGERGGVLAGSGLHAKAGEGDGSTAGDAGAETSGVVDAGLAGSESRGGREGASPADGDGRQNGLADHGPLSFPRDAFEDWFRCTGSRN